MGAHRAVSDIPQNRRFACAASLRLANTGRIGYLPVHAGDLPYIIFSSEYFLTQKHLSEAIGWLLLPSALLSSFAAERLRCFQADWPPIISSHRLHHLCL